MQSYHFLFGTRFQGLALTSSELPCMHLKNWAKVHGSIGQIIISVFKVHWKLQPHLVFRRAVQFPLLWGRDTPLQLNEVEAS